MRRVSNLSEGRATVLWVEQDPMADLTPLEREALLNAGRWYARYRARDLAEEAHDDSAYAIAERERYFALITALRKQGVSVPLPDELARAAA